MINLPQMTLIKRFLFGIYYIYCLYIYSHQGYQYLFTFSLKVIFFLLVTQDLVCGTVWIEYLCGELSRERVSCGENSLPHFSPRQAAERGNQAETDRTRRWERKREKVGGQEV